ncbi:MAG TPA: methyltransferase domain-containing protein [Geminicoccaceae bacterium]|jgi:ubiquinone/menaquinone biosynthesis C-methylase UbiE|nr:methyltransferase domain-containing protein [Geminicoccaceae bacterium]
MGQQEQLRSVVHFYETHPINEQQILHDLARDGITLEGLTEEILKDYDQDHFGGLEAVDILAEKAGIGSPSRVLDVCSGMGGPARYLAHRLGCRVTGLELTKSRHEGAVRLTALVGLDHLVDFRLGNALDMPFADATFDVVIGQEAFAHVPDKPRLIAECARVVRPGGTIAFTDILRREALSAAEFARLRRAMTFQSLESLEGYGELLTDCGCAVIAREDLSAWWSEVLKRRLEMYRSLEDTTVAKFGAAHFQKWDETYAFFVGLFAAGRLGGGRFVARRET